MQVADVTLLLFFSFSYVNHTSVQLHRSICSDLLPSLVPGPPDTEALRVYLLLPLYHEFLQARHFDVLQCPLAAAILALKPEPAKVLGTAAATIRFSPERPHSRVWKRESLVGILA